jgi:hypothetical protein
MFKNITLILFLIIILFSCGKKEDPFYEEKKTLIKNKTYKTIII